MKLIAKRACLALIGLAFATAARASSVTIAAAGPFTFGQTASITATVTGASPSGYVAFFDSGTYLGTAKLTAVNGSTSTATYSTKLLAPMSHSIVATYLGDNNGNAISRSLPKAVSVTTLGASGFTAAANSPIQTAKPFQLAAGDFNEDGVSDLVVASSNPSIFQVSVFLGDPQHPGQFLTPSVINTTGAPNCVVVGDFAHSGHQGFAVGTSTGFIDVYAGTGTGQFSASPSQELGPLPPPIQLIATDANNDGVPDLISIGYNVDPIDQAFHGFITTLLGNGDGTFTAPNASSPLVYNFILQVEPWVGAIGDYNGDGFIDIAVPDRHLNQIYVLLGNGTGSFTAAAILDDNSINAPDMIAAADFNGDGVLDLAVANSGSAAQSLLIYLGATSNQGSKTVVFGNNGPSSTYSTGPAASGLTVGDINGDGLPDITVTNFSGLATVMLNSSASPGTQFTLQPGVFPNTLNPAFSVLADFNGDGRPDLAVTDDSSGNGALTIALGTYPTITGAKINAASVTSVIAGTQPLTLELDGANIAAGSTVLWQISGNPTATLTPATIDPSGNSLTVSVPAAQVAASGSGTISIVDPTAVTSNALTFRVAPPAPTLVSLSVASAPTGTNTSVPITISGAGFSSGDQVLVQGSVCPPCHSQTLPATANGTTQLSFSIPSNLLDYPDSNVSIIVQDPYHDQSNALTFQVVNPAISNVTSNSGSFTSVGVDSGSVTLLITGTNFVAGISQAYWTNPCTGGTAAQLSATATATQITATLPSAKIGSALATACLTVQNQDSHSTSGQFQVAIGSPTIASINPPSASVGGNLSITATLTGTNFVAGSAAFWCNNCTPPTPSSTPPACATSPTAALCALNTTFVSPTQLTVTIPGGSNGLLQSVSAPSIIANNAGAIYTPASIALSSPLTFPVSTVIISSISPNPILVGSPQTTLTISGQGFESNAVVLLNGTSYSPTAPATNTQVSVNLPASLLASPNTISVAVLNPSDGSQSPAAQPPLTVGQMAITGYTPTPVVAGAPSFTMGLTGAFFTSSVQVHWVSGGTTTNLATTYIDANDLSVIVPANLVAAAGTSFLTASTSVNGTTITSPPFSIAILGPSINSNGLNPSSQAVGAASFILDIQGLNFLSGATAQWATGTGTTTPLPTVFLSASELNAVVPSNLLLSQGIALVSVVNPSPSGVTGAQSNGVLFSVGPAPTISALGGISPNNAAAGASQALTITVTGTNYATGSVVQWNNSGTVQNLPTSVQSSTTLTATVSTALLASPGSAIVTVVNPGGADSNTAVFTIGAGPTPTVTGFSPSTTTAGGGAFQLTVNGVSFNQGAQVMWNPGGTAQALTTIYVSSTQLTAVVPASLVASSGTATVTVIDAGGGVSTPTSFIISPAPSPTIQSFSPAAASANAQSFTLTVTGSNFVSGAVVQWNGGSGVQALPTIFVSSVQLNALVTGSLVAGSGVAFVNVVNPGSVSGPATTYTVSAIPAAPTISSTGLSPSSVAAGGSGFLITITGTGFVTGTVAQWDGANLLTTVLSSTQLAAEVTATDIATQGTHFINVSAPGNLTSNLVPFTVTAGAAPAPQINVNTGLSQYSAVTGSAAFTLGISGLNFTSSSVAQWLAGGITTPLTTAYLSATQLTALVPAALLATAGPVYVEVQNAPGLISNLVSFNVGAAPVPTIQSFNPTSATANGTSFTLIVTGANFVSGSVAQWNAGSGAQSLSTSYLSSTQLSALVPGNLLASAGIVFISVMNPGANSGGSVSYTVSATPTSPTISANGLNPSTATAGSTAFLLNIAGSGFVSGTVAQWDGVSLPSTVLSSTAIAAQVSADKIASQGSHFVGVITPGGLTSNLETLTVTAGAAPAPLINATSGLTQYSASTGAAGFTLGVTGANFVSASVVQWIAGGVTTPLSTAYLSSTQLTALVPASLLAAAGPAYVEVQNSAGIISNLVGFTVTAVSGPTISVSSGLSPAQASTGSAALQLTVTGTGFQSGAVVIWNTGTAQNLVTGFISSTQLTALVPASLLLQPAIALVEVQNPDKQISNTATFQVTGLSPSAVPTVTSISPTTAAAGSNALQISVTGTNFSSGVSGSGASAVQWNGTAVPTTYISATQLSANISSNLLTSPGNNYVNVSNSTSAQSNGAQFIVSGPAIASISPTTATAGGQGFTLTVTGANFVNGSNITWNGGAISTAFISSTQLTAQISTQQAAAIGTALIGVTNPGGATSNPQTLTLSALVPTLGSLQPSSASAGSATFQLVVAGSNFETGSAVLWNGIQLPTTVMSSTQLNAIVDASLLTTAGNAIVLIQNPGPSSSSSLKFAINAPVITSACVAGATASSTCVTNYPSLGPNASSAGIQLTVTGQNFLAGSTVQWNGTGLPTVYTSATQLTAYVAATFLASQGAVNIAVQNPGGAVSSAVAFTVGPFTLSIATSALPDAIAGLGYVNPASGPYLLAASGGTPPYAWSLGSSALPQGMTLDPNAGALSGSPTAAGSVALSFTVTDSAQRTASKTLTLRVVSPLTVTTTTPLPLSLANSQVSVAFAASGGTTPYKWSATGPLPSGLSLDPSSGLLTGMVAVPGNYQFSVSVSDSGSNGGQSAGPKVFNLEVAVPDLTLSGLAATSQPDTQPYLNVSVANAYSTNLTGTLTLAFTSAVGVDDPAIAFSTGGRTVNFTIPAGATSATFGQESKLAILTGTNAGTITIQASIQVAGVTVTPASPPQIVTQIAKQAPVITSLSMAPTTGGVLVTISGFSTARDVSQASFTFNPAPGSTLTSSTQTANLSSTFSSWYASAASAAFGSQFTIAIPYPISGNVSAIGSVTVALTNSIGVSAPVTAQMQ